MEKVYFDKNIVILGFGAIAQAVLPLITDHLDVSASNIKVLSKELGPDAIAEFPDITFHAVTLTKENYQVKLQKFSKPGDLIVNLTAEVGSLDLMRYCTTHGYLYLDTCIELWAGEVDVEESKTYHERESVLALKHQIPKKSTTALSSMGANPGIVSLLTKRLILKISETIGDSKVIPKTHSDWAKLARKLSVRAIHVNERDTQFTKQKAGSRDFFSTWSVEAMIVESLECAEMSIGTHEKRLPPSAYFFDKKTSRAIYFTKSGKDVRIRTWLPLSGEQIGMILNHNEPFSIAELYSIHDKEGKYSPTVCFVYHPSEQTMCSLEHLTLQNCADRNRVLMLDDIQGGYDELGVLVMTENHGSFWLGSQLSVETAQKINPKSSATSLQVAAGVIAGMCWIVQNPNCGIIEPEEIPQHDLVLDIADRYWGYIFKRSNWRPHGDTADPSIQFNNFLA